MKDDARKFFWLSLLMIAIAAFVSHRLGRGILSAPDTKEPASVISVIEAPAQIDNREQKINPGTKQKGLITVLRVIDGDTIDVLMNGTSTRVRLIGINSPELNDKRAKVACFAEEAKTEAEKLLNGQNVRLEKDPTQGDYDKYNRLLAYVFLGDGTNFNKLMIENGYAYEYTYRPGRAGLPYKYQSEFKAAQGEAKNEQRGLWNENICN